MGHHNSIKPFDPLFGSLLPLSPAHETDAEKKAGAHEEPRRWFRHRVKGRFKSHVSTVYRIGIKSVDEKTLRVSICRGYFYLRIIPFPGERRTLTLYAGASAVIRED